METITYLQLKTNIKEIQEIRTFYLLQEINEHARCCLTGIVKEDFRDNYIKEEIAESVFEVYAEGDNRVILFKGAIEGIKITSAGGLYQITVKGISASYLMDIKERSRSFQDRAMIYSDLVRKVMKDYSGGDIIDCASKEASLDKLIIQYRETDWSFLKRLASQFNMGIIPSVQFKEPKIFFGTYEGPEKGEVIASVFTTYKMIRDYKRLSENTDADFNETDAVGYEVETTEDYEIGDQVIFQNHAMLIKKKEINLEKGILLFRYQLCSRKGMGTERIFNPHISGVSLNGTVLEVVRDKIKVHLCIDEKQDVQKAWEFPYGTLYTAEGHSGWYCMPEIDDTVTIYFPSSEENEAVGTSSVRSGLKGTDKIEDPKVKYFRTANGQELKFAPEEIVITCINGEDPKTGEKRSVYIKLNQENGIEIMSTEPIRFKSDKGIKLEAEETIEMTAKEQIKLHCKQSEIKLDSIINICGPDVKIN